MIASGQIEPGAKLREEALAAAIGVSRTPVREALRRLAAEGVVEMSPHRGARLVAYSRQDLDALFELRALLEPHAVLLAVPQLSDEDVQRLTDLATEMNDLVEHGAVDRLSQLNNEFHRLFLDRSGNRLLAGALAGVIRPSIVARTFHRYTPEALSRSQAHHLELAAAARARDGQWAEAVMRAHILAARHTLDS